MRRQRVAIVLLVLVVLIILVLLFHLVTVNHALNDQVMVLIEQIWYLHEWCLVQTFSQKQQTIEWPVDALLVQGRKGELMIRRFALQKEWARQYRGYMTDSLSSLRALINEIDFELIVGYRLNLKVLTSLTQRMIEDIYHHNIDNSINVTKTIIASIRQL